MFHTTYGRIILKRTSENKLLMFKICRVTKCPSLTVDILLLRQIILKVSKVRLSFSYCNTSISVGITYQK